MAKTTKTTIASGFNSNSALNTNFDRIDTELNDKVLYRNNPTGEPNQMENDLDMNSNRVLNLPDASSDQEPATKSQLDAASSLVTINSSTSTYNQGGTGATNRTIQNKFQELVSVKDFGAVGDGVADDFAAINAAVDAVTSGILVFPAGTYKIINTEAIDLNSDVTYLGLGGATISFTDNSIRVFLAQSKSRIRLENIKIVSTNEAMQGAVGGGYVRFENCSDIHLEKCEVSNHAWDGVKFQDSTNISVKDSIFNYGKSTGITLETCTDVNIARCELNKQGLNSADDTFADLPTGWSGTHVGRGITMLDNCQRVTIKDCVTILNSEYGIRSYADSSNIGNKNIRIENCYAEDNGHPSGTYGPIVLGSNKGVDILIDSDATLGETDRVTLKGNEVLRKTKDYGTAVSLNGTNHQVRNNVVRFESPAIHTRNAYLLFGPKDVIFDGNSSTGAKQHIVFGGSNPERVHIVNDTAYDCLIYIQGNSTGTGQNVLRNFYAQHRTTAAVSTENGFNPTGTVEWIVSNGHLDGFHRSVVVDGTVLDFSNVKTTNSVDLGIRDNQPSATTVFYNNCRWDSSNPFEKVYSSNSGESGRSPGVDTLAALPTNSAYYQKGHVSWHANPGALDVTHNRRLIGWYKLTTGTANVLDTDWQAMWVHNDETTA